MGSGGRQHELIDGGRGVANAGAVDARSLTGLRAIARRARGWTCDVRGVALDVTLRIRPQARPRG